MYHRIMHPASVLCAAALIAACAQNAGKMVVAEAEAQTRTTESPFAPVPYMRLMIAPTGYEMRNAVGTLDEPAKVTALLNDLEAPPGITLRRRINDLIANPTRKLAGLGGIQAYAALETAKVTLVPPGQSGAGDHGGPLTTFSVKGQIQDVVDLGNGNTERGFYYKHDEPMHMWVKMITTTTRITPGNDISRHFAQMFRIRIPARKVEVEPKDTDDLSNVFPDFEDMAFAVNADMAAPFNYKLWAVGTNIEVTDYWESDPYNPQNPKWKKYKKGAPTPPPLPAHVAKIFEPDSEACIDMMFVQDPDNDALDNGHLPNDADPPYYCLGRCKNPPIVNTR